MTVIPKIIMLWLLWGLVFTGIGRAIISFFNRFVFRGHRLFLYRSPIFCADYLFDCFWIGWASTLFFLEIAHFLTAINQYLVMGVVLISLVGWLSNHSWTFLDTIKSKVYLCVCASLLSIVIASWLVLMVLSNVVLYDHPLYYLQQISWAKHFPIIPGLANLYNRLGFYDVFFLYTALLSHFPSVPGYTLSVSLLVWVVLIEAIASVLAMMRNPHKRPMSNVFMALIGIPVFMKTEILGTINVSVTDTVIFVLTIIVFKYFLNFLSLSIVAPENFLKKRKRYSIATCLLTILCLSVAGIMIKGSFLFVGISVSAMSYGLWRVHQFHYTPLERKIVSVSILMIVLAGLLPFFLRNVIVSGYALYPFPYFSFPVDWRVPFDKTSETFYWVLSWSRAPYMDWHMVLKNSAWFVPWLKNMKHPWVEMILPASIFVITSSLLIWKFFLKTLSLTYFRIWSLFVGTVGLSVCAWFISTPDLRFLGSQFLVLATGSLTVLVVCLRLKEFLWQVFAVVMGSYVCGWVCFAGLTVFHTRDFFKNNSLYQKHTVALNAFTTSSGLVVYQPAYGEFCWNARVLCTPYPDARLMLRKAQDVYSGFRTRE